MPSRVQVEANEGASVVPGLHPRLRQAARGQEENGRTAASWGSGGGGGVEMGPGICPKHGDGWFISVCPHVVEAKRSSCPCPGIELLEYQHQEIPQLSFRCWFCPTCIAEHVLLPTGSIISEDFFVRTSPLYRPMCPDCFKEWREKEGT